MTEGYIWTGQYPESKRVIEKGNNHSMELDEDHTKAFWTNPNNSKGKFFIINESVFSKLCILGEEYEPCFEGASISKVQFSFNEEFNQKMYSMEEVSKYINKGGETMPNTDEVLEVNVQSEETPVVEEATADAGAVEFKKKDEEKKKKEDAEGEDAKKEEEKDAEKPADNSKASGSESKKEDKAEDESSDDEEEDEKKKKKDKKNKYALEEIPEYVELTNNYSVVVAERDSLNQQVADLQAQIDSLTQFKNQAERKDKEAMINSFYMLSDAEKADVVENIDKYSVDDIEAKLSVICVRNKVNFNLDEDDKEEDPSLTFNLDETNTDSAVPAWVKAVLETSKNL